MTRFLTALTLAIFCLEFASCELTLENVYAEVLSLRTVVKSMEKKLLVQEVQMGELNKIISEQRDLLDQARAENRESSWEVPHTEEGTKTKEFLRGQQEGVSVSDVISNNTSSYFTHHPQDKEPINGGHRFHRGIDGFLRQDRLLDVSTPPPPSKNTSSVVAFYAYLSTTLGQTGLGPDHTIKFDVVKTNQGNGYHSGSGVFIAPQTGFYVFTWTIRVGSYDHSSPNFHSTEIVINNNVYGSSYALAISDSSRDDSGTGTVVAHVNQGDDVYIKTHSSHHGGGGILSEGVGRSSFSGWKLN